MSNQPLDDQWIIICHRDDGIVFQLGPYDRELANRMLAGTLYSHSLELRRVGWKHPREARDEKLRRYLDATITIAAMQPIATTHDIAACGNLAVGR